MGNGGLPSQCIKEVGKEIFDLPDDLSNSWIAQSLPPEWLEGFTFPEHWPMTTRLLVSTVFAIFYNWAIMDPLFHMGVVIYKLGKSSPVSKANATGDDWNTYRYYA